MSKLKREIVVSQSQFQPLYKNKQKDQEQEQQQSQFIQSMQVKKKVQEIAKHQFQQNKSRDEQIALPFHPKIKKSLPKSTHDLARALKDIQKIKNQKKNQQLKKQIFQNKLSILSPKAILGPNKPPQIKLSFQNQQDPNQIFKQKKVKKAKQNCSANDNKHKMPYRFGY